MSRRIPINRNFHELPNPATPPKSRISSPRSVTNRCSRPWRWPAAKLTPRSASAELTARIPSNGGFLETLFDPCDLSKNELAAEAIRSFGALRLRVTGSSMLPAVRPDDVLLIRHCRIESAGPGDIVLYIRQRRLFAHRVISRSGARLVTQGDGIGKPDLPVTANELLGKVIRVMRRGKTICPESKLTLPARMAVVLFRRSVTAGRIFARLQGLQGRASL